MANRHRWQLKQFMVRYKGGKCQLCGYNKCLRALDFHHADPKEKDFQFGANHNFSWERLRQELDKCILVCRNCHSEVEYDLDMQMWGKDISETEQAIAEALKAPPVDPDTIYTRNGWEEYHPYYKYGKGKTPRT
jgi:hypothetical protein